jgi:hypothetical protein
MHRAISRLIGITSIDMLVVLPIVDAPAMVLAPSVTYAFSPSGVVDGRQAAIMHVNDSDVAPLTPTANPRAQLNTRINASEGTEQLITWGTRFGADFPSSPSWSVFAEWFTTPYSGSPRIGMGVRGGVISMASMSSTGMTSRGRCRSCASVGTTSSYTRSGR